MDRRFQTLNGDDLDAEKRWNKKQYRDLQSRSRQTANATFSSLLSLKLRYENWSRGSIWRLPVVVNVLLNWLSNDSENKTADVLDVKLSGLVNILSRLKRRKMILYVSVNSDKPDFFRFLGILWLVQLLSTKSRLPNCRETGQHFAVPKGRIAQYISNNRSQSNRSKIAIHWLG